MKRATFTDKPVNYAAVGATQSQSIVMYPPEGYSSFETSVRLGSGKERFETACEALMTWGVQRETGIKISDISQGDQNIYAGIQSERFGLSSLLKQDAEHDEQDQIFTAEGHPYVRNGMSAKLDIPFLPQQEIRVVYVLEEENRHGFAYGTLEGCVLSEENGFFIELRKDSTVWFRVRSFSRPLSQPYRFLFPLVYLHRKWIFSRYLRVLHPVHSN